MFEHIHYLHVVFLSTVSVFFREFLSFLFECIENFKIKIIPDDKDIQSTVSPSNKGESSGSGNKSEPSGEKSIMDDPRNFGNYYESSDEDKDWEAIIKKAEQGESSTQKEESPEPHGDNVQGITVENFEESIKDKDTETIKELKTHLEKSIGLYQSGISPESEKQISDLQAKVIACNNRISELDTDSTDPKGKGKAK